MEARPSTSNNTSNNNNNSDKDTISTLALSELFFYVDAEDLVVNNSSGSSFASANKKL